MTDQPLIDAPGVYMLRGGGYAHVVSMRGKVAIGWIVQDGVGGFGLGAWSIADGRDIEHIDDDFDLIGSVTEPVTPPGMEFIRKIGNELSGSDFETWWFGVPNKSGGHDRACCILRNRHIGRWSITTQTMHYKPLHVALGELWSAVLEGKR